MIDPRQVAFDIDGVVANTMQLFIDIARENYGIRHIGYQDITRYRLTDCLDLDPEIIEAIVGRIIEGDYACPLAPFEGASQVLQQLSAFGPIRLVTARPHPGPMQRWMARLLPPERHEVHIAATGSFELKAEVLLADEVAYFVEDRLDTCYLLRDKGIAPVLFVQPWNREPHPFIEVQNWSQLKELIDWS